MRTTDNSKSEILVSQLDIILPLCYNKVKRIKDLN
nr:MAG TPA: hypothetical protein [Caudoviricetes sp.]